LEILGKLDQLRIPAKPNGTTQGHQPKLENKEPVAKKNEPFKKEKYNGTFGN